MGRFVFSLKEKKEKDDEEEKSWNHLSSLGQNTSFVSKMQQVYVNSVFREMLLVWLILCNISTETKTTFGKEEAATARKTEFFVEQ